MQRHVTNTVHRDQETHLPSGGGINGRSVPLGRPARATVITSAGSLGAAAVASETAIASIILGNQGVLAANLGMSHLLAIGALNAGICK